VIQTKWGPEYTQMPEIFLKGKNFPENGCFSKKSSFLRGTLDAAFL